MAAISGITGSVTYAAGYVTNAHQWEADLTGEALETTPFSPGSNYRTRIAGLLDWNGSYTCWINATGALPSAGTSGSATFVAVSGRQYAGTILVTSARAGVAADGSQRNLTVTWVGAAVPTPG